jgi:hypothetical protein
MRFTLLLAAAVILVRDPTGKGAGDPLHPWFESLRNKVGLYCCAKADGHVLDDGEWASRTIVIASSSKAGGLSCLTMRYFQDLTSLARQ